MRFLSKLLGLAFVTILFGCNQPKIKTLQEGDILFQDLDCGPLCDAIEAVTEGVNGKDFSHCAMVVKIDDTLRVVEAIGDEVQVNSISNFYSRVDNDPNRVLVGRLKKEYQSLVQDAASFTIEQIGAGYDDVFLLNNQTWYCSELIYESLRTSNEGKEIFQLAPMTFKDPSTNEFFPAWVDYYAEMGEEIPEGELGLNPGSISRSDRIEIVEINLPLHQ